MREQDLKTLEFDKVLALLATCALSSVGREACLALRPEPTPDTVAAHSERTWQFFCLLARTVTFPLRPFPAIRPALRQASHKGVMLEGQKLLEILDVVELSRTLGAILLRATAGDDQLADLPSRLLSFPLLAATLHRCLTETGQLADEASPELTALRRRLRSLREEIEHRREDGRAQDLGTPVSDGAERVSHSSRGRQSPADFSRRLCGHWRSSIAGTEPVYVLCSYAKPCRNHADPLGAGVA